MPGATPGLPITHAMSGVSFHIMDKRIMDACLDPMNWCMTYGPYELHNWQEYVSFCEQLVNGTAFYNKDADDYMEYTSSEVI